MYWARFASTASAVLLAAQETRHQDFLVFNVNVAFDDRRLDKGPELIAQLIVNVIVFVTRAQREDEHGLHLRHFLCAGVAVKE